MILALYTAGEVQAAQRRPHVSSQGAAFYEGQRDWEVYGLELYVLFVLCIYIYVYVSICVYST